MGYSAAAAAISVLNTFTTEDATSNTWTYSGKSYFYEVGKENRDGAVTGSVWRVFSDGRAERAGSFRIEPNGAITRAPFGLGHRLDRKRAHAAFVASLSPQEKWARACDFDGIEPSASFVVFSPENPYAN